MPRYEVVGQDLQAVICHMTHGEKVIAEAGHLLALSDGLELETSTGGGFMSGVKRALGGSSFFINEIEANVDGQVVFSSPSPGHIRELDISSQKGWLCQPHVFLCADESINISAAMTKRFGAGLFGGTGFILQSLQGQGKAFIHVGGAALHYELKPNQSLRVETGALAAFESTVTYDIQMVKGLKSILFSGDGMWFAHLTGPGAVYIQTLALPRLAHALVPYMPENAGASNVSTSAGAVVSSLVGSVLNGRGSSF